MQTLFLSFGYNNIKKTIEFVSTFNETPKLGRTFEIDLFFKISLFHSQNKYEYLM